MKIMTTPQTSDQEPGLDLPTQFVDLLEMDWEAGDDVQVTCPECQGTFLHNEHLNRIFPNTHCDDCCESVMAKKVAEANAVNPVSMQDKITSTIPRIHLDTELERLPYPQRQQVLNWEATQAKGLWLVGHTRTGKTRSLCMLIEKLIRAGHEVDAHFHGRFTDDLLEVIRSERSFKAWKNKISRVPVLAIDDLFSNKMTERSEASLFEILDERISWERPTLVTTQVTAKDAQERFHSAKRCHAFFARVKEFFTIVPFHKDTQGELI